MPRIPKLCFHRSSGNFYVWASGRRVYLGRDQTKAEKARVQMLDPITQELERRPGGRVPVTRPITISELVARYLEEVVAVRYRHADGTPTYEQVNIARALTPMNRCQGEMLAGDYGPGDLEQLQGLMASNEWKTPDERKHANCKPWCCSQINKNIQRIRRMFRWATRRKLCPSTVYADLLTVDPLRPGQHGTTEPPDVPPVPLQVVNSTLPFLAPILADMVRIQLWTGARPGEICALTPDQVDRTGDKISLVTRGAAALPKGCWAIIPTQHKGSHRGKTRVIPVGPQAQQILAKYLDRPADQPCFSPRESREAFDAARRAARVTPMTPSQRARKRKAKPKKKAGDWYDVAAYGRAIRAAASKAGQPHWHPHQLRHTAATLLAREFGAEVARIVCGHSSLATTGIYVERDLAAAFAAIAKVG